MGKEYPKIKIEIEVDVDTIVLLQRVLQAIQNVGDGGITLYHRSDGTWGTSEEITDQYHEFAQDIADKYANELKKAGFIND